MARLHLKSIERHVEKLAVTAAAAVLLLVTVFYGISSPNTVVINGQTEEHLAVRDQLTRRTVLSSSREEEHRRKAIQERNRTPFGRLQADRRGPGGAGCAPLKRQGG